MRDSDFQCTSFMNWGRVAFLDNSVRLQVLIDLARFKTAVESEMLFTYMRRF